uniref:Methyltransferase n=1 Tax=Parageobacillus thermoglucosidasius TaxID=1426 RepID=Q2I0L9_PARTM|nr:M2.BtsI [Parageobacillus thermoglucosidasius]
MKKTLLENTDLQSLVCNIDWEFKDANTQYLTHNLHRYSGKFIPQIAKSAIELLTQPGDTILDPYMGSGTTLVEAVLLNRFSIGIDLNPLAVLIAQAKVTPIEREKLDFLITTFTDLCESLDLYFEPSIFNPPLSNIEELVEEARKDFRFTNDWFTKWFQEKVLLQLIVIKRAIDSISDLDCRNLATVAFSNILRRSSNAHSGYPNVMYDKNAKERPLPAMVFLQSLKESVAMVESLDYLKFKSFKPRIYLCDNNNMPIPDNTIDAIITHPPYIGAIPYAEYGMLSLGWLGYNWRELDEKLTGGKRQSKNVVHRFKVGYTRMLQESYRVLKPGKKMFLLVGNPVVKGEVVDLGEMTKNLATEVGFSLIAESTRMGTNRRANKMGNEVLLFFQKN